MTMRKQMMLLAGLAACSVTGPMASAASPIPYPDALDSAAVRETRVADLNREGLIVGNGDLNALLWERSGTLCLRVAKNDVWDARIDTSGDPPMLSVDVANQKWHGGSGSPPSWGKPYPSPRPAAIVRIGAPNGEPWNCIRAGGTVNEWKQAADGSGVMGIEGKPGASAGFQCAIPPQSARFNRVQFKIAGTKGAKYYITLQTTAGIRESGWIDSPQAETAVSFDAPASGNITDVLIYIMTRDDGRAENRIREITLAGDAAPLVLAAGMASAGVKNATLDLRRAVATAGGTTVRALADRNVFLIDTAQPVSLEEIKSAVLPAAMHGETNGVKWLHMKMPGDMDYPGMEYALAVATNGTHKAVALATSFDTKGGDVRAAAVQLARQTVATDSTLLIARHEAGWHDYWAASGVRLDDADLQPWWYRMVYMLRCFSKPGVVPSGLWAFQPTDSPNWHGDYHHNYNAWQPFWSAFNVNHADQAKPWVDYMNGMLPRLKWLARELYDCEGAFVGISSFAFEPDPAKCRSVNRRQIAFTEVGSTLGMIGMSAQVLWHHHLYQPDRSYLETSIYPVIKEAALFYCSFAEKCPRDADGKVKLGPSYSPEHGGFGVANVPFDLAYARFTLKAAITAAGELGCDREFAARCRQVLAILPDYPTAPDAQGNPLVVDWTGCKFRQIAEHNIAVPAVPVFPGEQVTWFSPEPEKELFRNTLRQTRHRGCNSTIMLSVAKARLGMPEGLDDLRNYYKPLAQPNGMFYWPLHGFYLSESTGIAAGISEFLLQSVDDVIRVFPCWPKTTNAEFTNLRAQGGFLVSASLKSGVVSEVRIESTCGKDCSVANPWPELTVRIIRNGKPAESGSGPRLTLKTAVNEILLLKPGITP